MTIARATMIAALLTGLPATAATPRETLKYADSFRVGTEGVLCTAQLSTGDTAVASMFDRGYSIVCRDAAAPIGRLFVLRGDAQARLNGRGEDGVDCGAASAVAIADLPGATQTGCTARDTGLAYTRIVARGRGATYAVEGLKGYETALMLALRSAAADRVVPGIVAVSATDAGDAASFARVQAGSLDPDQTMAQGYLRNNAGSFAEAAAFFDVLVERTPVSGGLARTAEYLANDALQQSNLGNFPEADSLFRRAARAADASDPLQLRMLRNFRAIDRLNRLNAPGALTALNAAVPGIGDSGLAVARLRDGYIDRPIAQRLNTDEQAVAQLRGVSSGLTTAERVEILDAQAQYLRGAALRLTGKLPDAKLALLDALKLVEAVRGGRVRSATWMRAASYAELSSIAEAQGNGAEALRTLQQAVALYAVEYPNSATLLAAKARMAALAARQGQSDAAITAYRDVVRGSVDVPGAGQAIRPLIAPYFDLLADRADKSASVAADFFEASQILARPGVAQTQAVLARELSGGSDESAALFRQSVTLTRDIVVTESEIGRLAAIGDPSADELQLLAAARARRDALSRDQTALLAKLSAFPRYRAVSSTALPLADLQAQLGKREAYAKMVLVGDAAFMVLVTADGTTVYRIGATTASIDTMVAAVRDSIVHLEAGAPVTSPFDLTDARALYLALFGPAGDRLAKIDHLIFEPDGAMLQLPINLLVTEDAGIDAYRKRNALPEADAFDTTGIAWLGRKTVVSTAVSPRAFADVRTIARSRATRAYLGLGENALPATNVRPVRTAIDDCLWPLATWLRPISAEELRVAATRMGDGRADIVTGAGFSDTALRERGDLSQYRVLHFATHGLVTAARPDCPARPALLTSFGGVDSDGLLSFREIFDLRLDAQTVILSACDTAGMATIAATREAGVSTGGNFALDGLVRAFVGAGARTVVASHWPVPDDFQATKRLIGGLFEAPETAPLGEALRKSSIALMDDPTTSHPYYWAAFAIVGDAEKPLR